MGRKIDTGQAESNGSLLLYVFVYFTNLLAASRNYLQCFVTAGGVLRREFMFSLLQYHCVPVSSLGNRKGKLENGR